MATLATREAPRIVFCDLIAARLDMGKPAVCNAGHGEDGGGGHRAALGSR